MAGLDSEQVVRTLERLKARVGARFPGSGLEGVATGLVDEARRTARQAEAIAKPYYVTRAVTYLVLIVVVTAPGWAMTRDERRRARPAFSLGSN